MQGEHREIVLLDTVVAGTSHCVQKMRLAQTLSFGKFLELRRDKGNVHDGNAIAVYADEVLAGWIPRAENAVISRLMDAGKAITCQVQSVAWSGDWLKIGIRVAMLD